MLRSPFRLRFHDEKILHEQAMTRTQRTSDCTPMQKHPDPHDKTRETDIVEANTTKP
jgi:hypothetical protein